MTENNGQNSKRPRALRSLAAAGIVLVLALAVAAFLFRDRLFSPDPADKYADIEPFTYETGSDQRFALCGDGLAIASTTGLQLTDQAGNTIAKSIFSMETPAVDASAKFAIFFDVGGTALRAANRDGVVTQLDTDSAIISADMAENGYFAVCTQETGYKGLATIYNSSLSPVYRWYSGSGWLMKCAVSPDGEAMAAICAESGGTVLHIFRLDSEMEKASLTLADKLYFDVIWLSGTRLCLISEDDIVFADSSAEDQRVVSFEGAYLVDYAVSGGHMSLFLSEYLTGGAGTLTSFDTAGDTLASVTTDRSLVSLSRSGERTLALYTDGCVLYNADLSEKGTEEDVLGVKSVLLRSDGKALMLSAYSGELKAIS